MTDYRSLSLWHDCLDESIVPRPTLQGPADVDVAIVGAGLTGLWTAYYLAKADPHLRIAVVEKHVAGYGASGRNGGWCSSFFAASHDAIQKQSGREAAIAMQRAMYDTVDEVGRVVDEDKIDARWYKRRRAHAGAQRRAAATPARRRTTTSARGALATVTSNGSRPTRRASA